jgi:hypothetical protein
VKPSTFAERLAYARWLYHGARGEVLSNTDIATAVKRTQPWVTKWADSDTPPRDYEVHEPLATLLGVDERWLIRGEGNPPRAELWDEWSKARRRQVRHEPPVENEFPRSARKRKDG